MKDWRIKDNKTLCLNMINRQKMKNGRDNFVDENYIRVKVLDIMRKEKCSELDATIILKKRIKEEYNIL